MHSHDTSEPCSISHAHSSNLMWMWDVSGLQGLWGPELFLDYKTHSFFLYGTVPFVAAPTSHMHTSRKVMSAVRSENAELKQRLGSSWRRHGRTRPTPICGVVQSRLMRRRSSSGWTSC
jgi:hypothetical protein